MNPDPAKQADSAPQADTAPLADSAPQADSAPLADTDELTVSSKTGRPRLEHAGGSECHEELVAGSPLGPGRPTRTRGDDTEQDDSLGELATDDSEITVISKKPPQQFCTSAFDWRKVGELLIGKQLGSFRLDALLGVGGMGAVFQATDLQLDRQVAVKVLNSVENDPEAERRFRIEAQSAARLDHQNIARVFHVGQDQGWNYIVLELVAGQTLRQWVASRGPLDLKTAIHFFRQLAAALDHAHQRNIIHRDIKPSNVLVADDLTVKIVDMGLARIQKSVESADHEAEAGMTLGTFDYLAPEQARDPRQADQQSDLYSLGCTLYFSLVGRPPFAEATSLEKLLSHSNSARPRVTASRPDLPPSVDRLVAALMAPRKADRVPTAREFERMLLNLRTEARPTLASTLRQPARPRRAWQRLVLMSVAMTMLLVTLSVLLEGGWRDPGIPLPDWPIVEIAPSASSARAPELDQPSATVAANGSQSIDVDNLAGSGMRTSRGDATGGNRQEEAIRVARTPSNLTAFEEMRIPGPSPTAMGRGETGLTDRPFGFQTPGLLVPFLSTKEADVTDSELNLLPWWQLTEDPSSRRSLPAPRPNSPDWFEAAIPGRSSANRVEVGDDSSSSSVTLVTTLQVVPPTTEDLGLTTVKATELATRPSVQRVSSLEQALASLSRYPNVRKIELHFSGVQKVAPLQIPPSSLREIQAAVGHRPILQFSQDFIVSPVSPPHLLLESGQLEISGIDFVWATTSDLGADFPPRLFEVPLLSRLVFKDCTFQQEARESSVVGWVEPAIALGTIVPSNRLAPTWVYTNTLPLTTWEGRKQGVLTFDRCLFHGQADIVNARAAHATLLRMTDCLVITAGTVVRWGERPHRANSTGIEIEIERSTVITGQALLQTQAEGGQAAAPVNLFAHDSLFATTDMNRGLLHHSNSTGGSGVGLPEDGVATSDRSTPDRPADWLFFDGFNNTLLANRIWSESERETGRLTSSIDFEQAAGSRWFRHDLVKHRTLSLTERNHLITRVFPLPLSAGPGESLQTYVGLEAAGQGVDDAVLPVFPGRSSATRSP